MDIMTKFGSLIICSLGLLSLTNGQQVSIMPPDQKVRKFVNESYFVSCMLPDGSFHADWYSPKGNKIDSAIQSRIRTENLHGVDLFLTRITTQDEGTYTCRSTKSKSHAQFQLIVIRPITFDLHYAEQWAEENKPYALKCRAQGHGQPSIHWKVDNRALTGNNSKYTLLKDGLRINNVTQADAARSYVCRALDVSSPIPNTKFMNISLKVKMKPKFLPGTRIDHWGVVNEWANLTCAVTAEPRAQFEWRQRERRLQSSDTVIIHNEENVSILQVLVRHESVFGTYECRVWNEMGSESRRMFLNKGRKPPVPKLELMQAGSDAAKFKVLIPNPMKGNDDEKRHGKILPITGLVVQFKMQLKTEWSPANFTPFDNYQGFILHGLTPQVSFNVRAALRNQAAQGDFSSSQFNFRTVQHSPYPISASPQVYSSDHQLYALIGITINFLLVTLLNHF